MKLKLVLENGVEFEGKGIGVLPTDGKVMGEVVFNTGMTGYQEVFTDPSYCDQIVTMTYPMIGNYGVNADDYENLTPHLKGIIIREDCDIPSNYRSLKSIDNFLKDHGLIGLSEIDTRELTRIIRGHGTMKGVICSSEASASNIKQTLKKELGSDQIARVSCKKSVHFPNKGPRVILVDFGYKKGILNSLIDRNCDVIVVPWDTSFEDIRKYNPQGIVLSNGPGDPKSILSVVPTIQKLQEEFPLLGICMGHQIFALANGADTEKMKFGHRGCNHPVKDIDRDRVFITSQNHGYAVKADSVANTELIVNQTNLNDTSVEGLKHKRLSAFSVQYHPEANPGPTDTAYIFDQFMSFVRRGNRYATK